MSGPVKTIFILCFKDFMKSFIFPPNSVNLDLNVSKSLRRHYFRIRQMTFVFMRKIKLFVFSKFRQSRPQCFKILTQTLLLKKANDLSWEKFAELCGKWVNPVQDIFECGRRDLYLRPLWRIRYEWVLCRFKVGFCPFPVRFFFCENTKRQCHFKTFKG